MPPTTPADSVLAATPLSDGWDPDSPMVPEHVTINMGALALAEERGSWYAVRRMLEGRIFAKIERFADEELRQRIAGARQRLATATEYERIHGEGSLLVKDHPFNIRMVASLAESRKRWWPETTSR